MKHDRRIETKTPAQMVRATDEDDSTKYAASGAMQGSQRRRSRRIRLKTLVEHGPGCKLCRKL